MRMKNKKWSIIGVLLVCASASLAIGDDAKKAASDKARLEKIFAGGAPQSLADLKAMEQHHRVLAKKVAPFTVGLRVGAAHGSGVIVSKDGFILTAAHVSQRPNIPVGVILSDGRVVRGTTMGMNRRLDAGLVKINEMKKDDKPVEWPHAEMGLSGELKAGQWCAAVGHPGGYQADRKVVFRVGRLLSKDSTVLYTDCPLIGGDSGGPLFDMEGNVIGIHSRIGNTLTANLHVPVNAYLDSWDRLSDGEAWGNQPGSPRPAIGVKGNLNAETATVESVTEGGPADRAGIKPGDVITKFDGADISGFQSLIKAVSERQPRTRVEVEVERNGKIVKLQLRIGAR